MQTYLDFEKPIAELEARVSELKETANSGELDLDAEIGKLEAKSAKLLRDTYSKLSPWQKAQVARHPERPHFKDYVAGLTSDFKRRTPVNSTWTRRSASLRPSRPSCFATPIPSSPRGRKRRLPGTRSAPISRTMSRASRPTSSRWPGTARSRTIPRSSAGSRRSTAARSCYSAMRRATTPRRA